ncbi:unnamed protein product [Calypogeia fissa]
MNVSKGTEADGRGSGRRVGKRMGSSGASEGGQSNARSCGNQTRRGSAQDGGESVASTERGGDVQPRKCMEKQARGGGGRRGHQVMRGRQEQVTGESLSL